MNDCFCVVVPAGDETISLKPYEKLMLDLIEDVSIGKNCVAANNTGDNLTQSLNMKQEGEWFELSTIIQRQYNIYMLRIRCRRRCVDAAASYTATTTSAIKCC